MSEINVESIMEKIQKNIDKKKPIEDELISFLARELSKINTQNYSKLIDKILNNFNPIYIPKQDVKELIEKQIEKHKTENVNLSGQESFDDKKVADPALNQLINRLERNRDLTNIVDPTLHFSSVHSNFLQKVFNLELSQNYLSALKYFIINELVEKQSIFNFATEESVQNIINLITKLQKENSLLIQELINYRDTSRDWIKNSEQKIYQFGSIINDNKSKLHKFESDINDNKSKLDKIELVLNNITKLVQLDSMLFDDETKIEQLELELKTDKTKLDKFESVLRKRKKLKHIETKFDTTTIALIYNIIFNRSPVPWETEMCSDLLKSQSSPIEFATKIRDKHLYSKICKNFLQKQGLSFENNEVVLKKINENLFYFDSSDPVLVEDYRKPVPPEIGTSELLSKLIKKGMNVINIGANIGYFTVQLAKLVHPEGKVFAFEPFPKNVKFLKRNIEANNLPNVTIIEKAVSNKIGKADLLLKESGAWHFVSSKNILELKKLPIDTTTIDNFLKSKNIKIDFVMMDAEGSEKYILDGMEQTIRNNPNMEIITEYNPYTFELAGTNGKEFLDKIEELGFKMNLIHEKKNVVKLIQKDELLAKYQYPKYANLYLSRN